MRARAHHRAFRYWFPLAMPLKPYAARVDDPRQTARLHNEAWLSKDLRRDFQRDRDRVIHAAAFRRLALKTQVFGAREGDHYRTRLTHSMEVAQIARASARALGLDEDLTEAVALAHDLGHPPFGHGGEETLNACMEAHGGFDHNAQTLRVVSKLERAYRGFDGLNLTCATLEGLVKHNGPLREGEAQPFAMAQFLHEHQALALEPHAHANLESQVAGLADDVAYCAHDVDDGLRAGFLSLDALAEAPIIAEIFADAPDDVAKARKEPEFARRWLARMLISRFVRDLIAASQEALAEAKPQNAAEARAHGRPLIRHSAAMLEKRDALKGFLKKSLYEAPQITRVRAEAARALRELTESYLENPRLIPSARFHPRTDDSDDARARRVCDYVAGMTDALVSREHRTLSLARADDMFELWRGRAAAWARGLNPAPPEDALAALVAEPPRDPAHGDVALNAAMVLARALRRPPRELGEALAQALAAEKDVARADVAGPGFVNLTLTQDYWREQARRIVRSGEGWGTRNLGAGRTANIEYVSANPTGPLHVGHMRGAVYGDALANILAALGWRVTREYYVNDAGAQMEALGRSTLARWRAQATGAALDASALEYPGDYLEAVAAALAREHGAPPDDEAEALALARARAGDAMLASIRADLASLGIGHDVFTHESALLEAGGAEATIEPLKARGLVGMAAPERPLGAAAQDWTPQEQLTFFSTRYGDDRDRPLRRPDGSWTYFAGDLAYHRDKIARGFDALIAVLGADHHGYAPRLEAATRVLSNDARRLETLICRLVRLSRDGEAVSMSKREGTFVTLRAAVEETSADAARFAMLFRRHDAALDYDLVEAVRRTPDNPVFYVQYAHARACSVMRRAEETGLPTDARTLAEVSLAPLTHPAEMALIAACARWPRALAQAGEHREPHRVARWLHETAGRLHRLWTLGGANRELRVLRDDDKAATLARLALMRAARTVLADGLRALGVGAPEAIPDAAFDDDAPPDVPRR